MLTIDNNSSIISSNITCEGDICIKFYNTTMGSSTSRFTVSHMILILLTGTLSFITVIGNVMVMISFKIDKQLQTISNYFLFSLAVADFAVGLISMPLFTVYTVLGYWPLGPFLCDTWLALDYCASNASVLNLLIISFDRYFSVKKPLTYRAKRSPRAAKYMILIAWGVSLFLWPPWIFLWPTIEGKRTVPDNDCYIQFIQTNQYITFGTAIAAFYIPVTVMCVLYFKIWKETEKRKKDLPNLVGGRSTSEEQTSVVDVDACSRDRSASHVETDFDSRSTRSYDIRKQKKPQSKGCAWIREWCIIWWHSGREEDAFEENYDDTLSEGGFATSVAGDTPTQPSYIRDPFAIGSSSRYTDNQPSKLVASRSVSSDSVYTILIRFPAADCEGAGGEGPSIKLIPEDYSVSPSSICAGLRNEYGNHSLLRRPSNISDLKTPLNVRSISRQNNFGSRSYMPKQPTTTAVGVRKSKKVSDKKGSEKKAAKTLSAILLAFIITWTPYNVLVLLKPLTNFSDLVPKGVWDFFYYLCYVNSTINPVIYALCNESFRRTYIRILHCKWQSRRAAMNRVYN